MALSSLIPEPRKMSIVDWSIIDWEPSITSLDEMMCYCLQAEESTAQKHYESRGTFSGHFSTQPNILWIPE